MKPEFNIKKQKTGTFQLDVQGDLTVSNGEIFKENLVALINRKGDLSLTMRGVASIDVSAIQLALAFSRACDAEGRVSTIIWPESKAMEELLEKTGIKNISR